MVEPPYERTPTQVEMDGWKLLQDAKAIAEMSDEDIILIFGDIVATIGVLTDRMKEHQT